MRLRLRVRAFQLLQHLPTSSPVRTHTSAINVLRLLPANSSRRRSRAGCARLGCLQSCTKSCFLLTVCAWILDVRHDPGAANSRWTFRCRPAWYPRSHRRGQSEREPCLASALGLRREPCIFALPRRAITGSRAVADTRCTSLLPTAAFGIRRSIIALSSLFLSFFLRCSSSSAQGVLSLT